MPYRERSFSNLDGLNRLFFAVFSFVAYSRAGGTSRLCPAIVNLVALA